MKTQYFVAFVMQDPFPGEIKERAAMLEQKFESKNLIAICPPHIVIKAPFELDDSHEPELIEIIRSCITRVAKPIVVPNGYEVVASNPPESGSYILLTYSDLLQSHAKVLRVYLMHDLNAHFLNECSVDELDALYCALGIVPVKHQYGVKVALELPRVSQIDHVALFACKDAGSWKEVHAFSF